MTEVQKAAGGGRRENHLHSSTGLQVYRRKKLERISVCMCVCVFSFLIE